MQIFSFFVFFLFLAFFEPTDMRMADKPFTLPLDLVRQIKFISPNVFELDAIAKRWHSPGLLKTTVVNIDHLFRDDPEFLTKVNAATAIVANYVDCILVTLGANGVLVVRKQTGESRFFNATGAYIKPSSHESRVQSNFYGVQPASNVINVSGAGDSFTSGFLTAMIRGKAEDICVSVGCESAKAALHSHSAVPAKYFAPDHLYWNQKAMFASIPNKTE